MNISPRTISKILHRLDLQPSVNTVELDNCMDEMQKIIKKKMGIADKMGHFQWMANIIDINEEEIS